MGSGTAQADDASQRSGGWGPLCTGPCAHKKTLYNHPAECPRRTVLLPPSLGGGADFCACASWLTRREVLHLAGPPTSFSFEESELATC